MRTRGDAGLQSTNPPIDDAHEHDHDHEVVHGEVSLPLYQTVWVITRFHLSLWHRMKVEGVENIPKTGGVVLAANHASHVDPPLLGAACPRPVHYLAKESLFKVPVLKWFLPKIAQVPVARDTKGRGLAVIVSLRLLRQGKVLGVFPEGTRSVDGKRQKARTGVVVLASKSHCPILPAYIYGTRQAMPKGAKLPFPGKPIGVRFGKPFFLTEEQQDLHDRQNMEITAEFVMDRIFELADPDSTDSTQRTSS